MTLNIKCKLNLTLIVGEEEKPNSIACFFFSPFIFNIFHPRKNRIVLVQEELHWCQSQPEKFEFDVTLENDLLYMRLCSFLTLLIPHETSYKWLSSITILQSLLVRYLLQASMLIHLFFTSEQSEITRMLGTLRYILCYPVHRFIGSIKRFSFKYFVRFCYYHLKIVINDRLL